MNFDLAPDRILAQALVLFLGIGIHEYCHCKFADMAGDPTPGIYGRVTLNLTKHFEPAGTLMMVFTSLAGMGLGWGRAAPMDPRKMRNPRWDFFAAVIAGPLSNLVQAVIYAVIFRVLLRTGTWEMLVAGNDLVTGFFYYWIRYGILINLGLAVFNMIPFGPLDGKWLLGLLMNEKMRWSWYQFNAQIGLGGLFIAVIFMQQMRINFTGGPVAYLYHLLTGTSL